MNKKRLNVLLISLFFFCVFFYSFTLLVRSSYDPVSEQDIFLRVDRLHEIRKKKEHIATPKEIRALYMSSWMASSPALRKKILDRMLGTKINALVLDIKDYSGVIAFNIENPLIHALGTDSRRIADIDEFLAELHRRNIYVIGRITVFQDPLLAKKKSALAFKRKDNGQVWKDRKGIAFLNPHKKEVWRYMVTLARESYDRGFDEINFDYIRYPSDGNISNLDYDLGGRTKIESMKDFYVFLDKELRQDRKIPISADFFGLAASHESVPGIGQKIADALPHFDAIAPMVYPSHYYAGTYNFKNPAEHPYEIVVREMRAARKVADRLGLPQSALRTWIQDFDLGAHYDLAKVRAQIDASIEAGVPSYMVWNPRNRYTYEAYK